MRDPDSQLPQYDQIDLTWWLSALARGKWIVLAFIAAAVAAALAFDLLYSTHHASGVVRLPPPDDSAVLWFSLEEYLRFASSDAVMEDVKLTSEYRPGLPSLREKFDFSLDSASRSLFITTSDRDRELAVQLANDWTDAFIHNVRLETQRQFNLLTTQASETLDSLQEERAKAQANLDDFDLTSDARAQVAALTDLEESQGENRSRLRTLTQVNIPGNESRLASLMEILDPALLQETGVTAPPPASDASEMVEAISLALKNISLQNRTAESRLVGLETEQLDQEKRRRELEAAIPDNQARLDSLASRLGDVSETLAAPLPTQLDPATGQATSAVQPVVNPVYYNLSQQIENTRTDLDVGRKQLETLQSSITANEASIGRVRDSLIDGQLKFDRINELLKTAQEATQIEADLADWRAEVEHLNVNIALLESQWQAVKRSNLDIEAARDELQGRHDGVEEELKAAQAEVIRLDELATRTESADSARVLNRPSNTDGSGLWWLGGGIVLSGIVGLVLGGAAVFLWELYRGGDRVAPAPSHPDPGVDSDRPEAG